MSARIPLARRLVAAAALALVAAGLAIQPALADPSIGVQGNTRTTAAPGATSVLTGLAVTGVSTSTPVTVNVSTDVGTLSLGSTTGITLANGNAATGTSSVMFSGQTSAVNAVLATVSLVLPGNATGAAEITLWAFGGSDAVAYNPDTGHFYQFVSFSGITWTGARLAASGGSFNGLSGYLATITSEAESDFVFTRLSGATNVWIGGLAVDTAGVRTWTWADGPEAGKTFWPCFAGDSCPDAGVVDFEFANWAVEEPNNYGNNERYAMMNYHEDQVHQADGTWNDSKNDGYGNTDGYIVEYGGIGTYTAPQASSLLEIAASEPEPEPEPSESEPEPEPSESEPEPEPTETVTPTPTAPPSPQSVVAAPTPTPTAAPQQVMAATGADGVTPLAALTGVLLAGGTVLLLGRRLTR